MKYAIVDNTSSAGLRALAGELGRALERDGFTFDEGAQDADLVLNLVDPQTARPYRRKARGTFVAALYECGPDEDGLAVSYPVLVRALANVVLGYDARGSVWFTTLERGHYEVDADGSGSLAEEVVARLTPLARARLVIDNDFRTDLEPELWHGDEITEQISEAGRRLDELDLLPSPFPIDDLLSERELRHVRRLYGLGGLSYGNLSARKDEQRFWMSASGVDKSKLELPGRDILLVSGYDAENARMVLSVPPGVEPRRVSVDAIEHWMIYQRHPDVGAILHVHAWMEDIAGTQINYPCGTEELAVAVSELIDQAPEPANAVVGLRNHGITATGSSLPEILDRIEPRIIRQVPMT
ncbi:MAG: class II aldolase/adducin family protein [Thermoleophilia bacterium]|nr:class II aldolase/adducin family protein [Thermoleophilia bacterium]